MDEAFDRGELTSPLERPSRTGDRLAVREAGQLRQVGLEMGYLEPAEDDGFAPRKFFSTIFKYRWLILAISALVVAASLVLTMRETPMFRAATTIEIQKQEQKIFEGGDVDPNNVADAEFIATQITLLQSRTLAERVVESLELWNDPRYANPDATRENKVAAAVSRLLAGVSVRTVARSRIIRLQFVGPHQNDVAIIANEMATQFIESNLERKYNSTAYARSFLEERLSSTKIALEASERALQQYAKEQGILNLDSTSETLSGGSSLDASSLLSLHDALNEAEASRIALEQRYKEVANNPDFREILESANIQVLEARLNELKLEYQDKLTNFKPAFPAMVKLQARIDGLESQIKDEQRRYIKSIETEYRTALAHEQSLKARIQEQKSRVQDIQERAVNYNILQREADTNRAQYEALLQRMKEVSIAAGIGSNQVSIVDPAKRPGAAFSPNLRNNLIWAAVLGLVAGCGLAYVLDRFDDRISSPEDVKVKLGAPILGIIPKVKSNDPFSHVLKDKTSDVTQAFFSLKATLDFTTVGGAPRSLVMTSSRPGEGKSSSVLGLAMSFAQSGKTVLIIDADLRKPTFGADRDASTGLTGILTNPDSSVSTEVIQQAQAKNLFLLPTGVLPPNPPELLASDRWPQILREAETLFDIVIVDSPPLLNFADAILLAAPAEACMLAIQAGAIRTPLARGSLSRLYENRLNVLGVVLTKFDNKHHGYGYGYGYGYGDGYGGSYGENNAIEDLDGRRSRGREDKEAARRRITLFQETNQYSED